MNEVSDKKLAQLNALMELTALVNAFLKAWSEIYRGEKEMEIVL
ncbi:MAG: hypothetical protein V1762_01590 [Nitrospirota bacterium]